MLYWLLSGLAFSTSVQANPLCVEAVNRTQGQVRELTEWARTRVLCDLRQSLLQKYSLLSLKQQRLGLNGAAHLDSCIEKENLVVDPRLYTFEDRVLQCLASFRDSHLSLIAQTPRPFLVNGLSFRKAGTKVILAGYDRKVIKLNNDPALEGALAIGAEVELIDGLPPQAWIARLGAYINASSPGAVEDQALRALGSREFSYPGQGTTEVRLKGASAPLVLNWFVHPLALRQDVRDHLYGQLQLRTTVKLGLSRTRPIDGYGDGFIGYDERNSLANTVEQTYQTDTGSPALETGFLNLPSGPACYLQILNSKSRKVRVARSNELLDRSGEIMRFARICQAGRLPMVVDLRRNSGGDEKIPLEDAAALTPLGAVLPSGFASGRYTQQLLRTLEVYHLGPEFPFADWNEYSKDRFYRSIKLAEEQGLEHLPAIPSRRVEAVGGGFDGKMVVLISPL